MKLEEAIKVLKNIDISCTNIIECKQCVFDNDVHCFDENDEDCQLRAIKTVLNALENSISKKKIEDKIEKRVTKLYAERDDNSDYASDYDFEIQLWEEMKQELLEE